MAYRVGQWATGNVGKQALRAIIEHPDLELVGLVVSDPAKVGKDAADLCGLAEPTGVAATDDPAILLAAAAGCDQLLRGGYGGAAGGRHGEAPHGCSR